MEEFNFDFGEQRPRVEPNANIRAFMKGLREIYTAALDEGFTAEESMQIICEIVAENIRGQQQ